MFKTKKFIILLALIAVSITALPATASASGFLPMWKAKAHARDDLDYITAGDPYRLSCYRWSRTKVRCNWTSMSYDGIRCNGELQERQSYYGTIMYSTTRRARCY